MLSVDPAKRDGDWDVVPIALPQHATREMLGGRFVELPESGWGALVGWVAGTSRLLRVSDDLIEHATTITFSRAGKTSSWSRPRTRLEQVAVDNDIDAYLADADVPARPRSFVWLLALPSNFPNANDLFAEINKQVAVIDPQARHPADIRPALARAISSIYAAG